METTKGQDTINGQKTKINEALEDAERMLYFASKGKIDDKTDLDCLKELAKAMVRVRDAKDRQKISEDILSHFYSQLAIMSHILYPITSESLKVMEGMSRHSCTGENIKTTFWSCIKKTKSAACSSPMLMVFVIVVFIVSLLITPWIFSYSMKGADIISRLDATMKDRVKIKKELIEEVNLYSLEEKKRIQNFSRRQHVEDLKQEDKKQPAGDPKSEDKKQPAGDQKPVDKLDILKITTLLNRYMVKGEIFHGLINQLDQWNRWIPGRWIVATESNAAPKDQEQAALAKKSKPEEGEDPNNTFISLLESLQHHLFKVREDSWDRERDSRMEKDFQIKNTGLLILQTINGTVLLLLFGFCGAAAFILKIVIQALQAHTFTGIRCTTWLRVLLGTFCGFFLGYLGSSNELLNLLTGDSEAVGGAPIKTISQVSALTLAFIGGYSVDLLFSILNRFIYAVTNDDRYLPASEIVRRKVDIRKFLDKERSDRNATDTKSDTTSEGTGASPESARAEHEEQHGKDTVG